MRKRNPFLYVTVIVILIAIIGFLWPVHAATSALTGNFTDAVGNPVNGYVILQLPVPAIDTATSTTIAPTPLRFGVVNGVLQSGPPVFDVAGLQPKNLYYQMSLYSNAGDKIMGGNYVITGSPFNLSAAIPTTVTTNNISYVTPAITSGSNTFSGTQNFTGQINSSVSTGTAPFVIASTTVVPNLNINDLNGVIVSGTPTTGQFLQATSPTTAGWSSNSLGGFKLECVNTTPVTVNSTASLSPLQGCTIAANDINASQVFYIDASGVVGATGTPTFTIGVYLDAVQVQSLTFTAGTANNQGWTLRTFFSGLTTGVTGTVSPSQFNWMSSPSIGGITTNGNAGSNAPATINTTASHTLQLQAQWGTANVANTITAQVLSIHRIG
jgi:hypothetical protein